MKIIRVQLDLPEDRVGELEELMKKAKISTRKELFNNALTLFEWAISEREKGKMIGSVDEKQESFQQLLMPSIQAVKPDGEPDTTETYHSQAVSAHGI